MDNYKVKVSKAADGTVSATAEKRTIGQAIGDSLTTLISDDEASVGYVKTAVQACLVYGCMLFAKYRQTSAFSWDPL